ncbi:unnamed protein product, partial [Durusdinium trenchii]
MFGRPSPLSKSRLNSRSRRISPPGTPTSQTLPGSANSPRRFLSQPRASEEIPSRSPSQPSWPSSPSSSAPPPSPGPPTAKQFEVEVQVCPREVPKGNQSAKHEVFRSVSSASTAHSTLVSDEGLATAAHAALVASEAMQEETARATAVRKQLEEQSRRLEAQLASANQMLQPLLQSHQQVQQLLQQMRPPGPYPQGHSSPRIDIPVPGPYPVQPIQVPVTRRTIQVVRPPQV